MPENKLYDEAGNEISYDNVDTSKGYIKQDKKFIQHHDAQPAVAEEKHYRVKKIYFEDGTILEVEGDNTDPHIVIEDDQRGWFDYKDMGEGRELRGMDLEQIIDVEKQEAKDPYDEYEDIKVYVLYTEEELKERQEAQEKAEKQQAFLEDGPDQLQSNTDSIDDLYVTMADLVAGSEE